MKVAGASSSHVQEGEQDAPTTLGSFQLPGEAREQDAPS